MKVLTEKLEVRLPPQTMNLLREEAKRRGTSLSGLAREAIERFLAENQKARLEAAEALFSVEAPVGDWGTMEKEIEEARVKG